MDDAQLARRFSALEAQVKLLSDHLGVPCPPFAGLTQTPGAEAETPPAAGKPADEVLELARAGKTTQAISVHRRLTGASLLEAKKFVESL